MVKRIGRKYIRVDHFDDSDAFGRSDYMSDEADGTIRFQSQWFIRDGFGHNSSFLRHRDNGPAVIDTDGQFSWIRLGVLHRLDGPAQRNSDGECYYQNGLLHRLDGPAEIWLGGSKFWYRFGKIHREDGPACEYPDGAIEYWIDGRKYLNLRTYRKHLKLWKIQQVLES